MKPIILARCRIGSMLLLIAATVPVGAQQVADTAFRPPIEKPAYPEGKGPVVLIDEAHKNFHTAGGRYLPFAELLRRDGYVVQASASRFTAGVLRKGRVLVMANATDPLTGEEIAAVRGWGAGGGSLLLIADHPPFEASARDLGKALGVRFREGVAWPDESKSGQLVFRRTDGTLRDHPVTKGVDEVATFTGTSFELDSSGDPLLVFGSGVYSVKVRNDPNPVLLTGQLQGAVLRFSKGRVAVFGEAAMFSAQVTGPDRSPMGMNAPIAKHNVRLLLNVMHWLTE